MEKSPGLVWRYSGAKALPAVGMKGVDEKASLSPSTLHGHFVGKRMVAKEASESSSAGCHSLPAGLVETQEEAGTARDRNCIPCSGSDAHSNAEAIGEFFHRGIGLCWDRTEFCIKLLAEKGPVSPMKIAMDTRSFVVGVTGPSGGSKLGGNQRAKMVATEMINQGASE